MTIREKIRQLADQYAARLTGVIDARVTEMQEDDVSHYLIYRVLRISEREGHLIDVYQNKGRFLYKYAGSFLEKATKLCFKEMLEALYEGAGGQYYYGDAAWSYVRDKSTIDLKKILEKIAVERTARTS